MKKVLVSSFIIGCFIGFLFNFGMKAEASYKNNENLPNVKSLDIIDKKTESGSSKVKLTLEGDVKKLKYLQISFRSKQNESPLVTVYNFKGNEKELILDIIKPESYINSEYVLEYVVLHGNDENKGINRYSLGDLGTGFKSILFLPGQEMYKPIFKNQISKTEKVIKIKTNFNLHKNNYPGKIKIYDSKGNEKLVKVKFVNKDIIITGESKFDKNEKYTIYLRDLEKTNGKKVSYRFKTEIIF